VAPATLAAAAANLPPDAGQRASAEVFKPITGAAPPTVRRPAPTALLIPSIGLDGRIVSVGIRVDQNNNPVWETAAFAVGHHQGSANPGEPGNVILSGHISSAREGDIFRDLPKVQLGDGLILRTPERDYLYTVDAMETVLPAEVSVLAPTGEARAILITCVPDRVYSHRLIVSARQV
jgi:sortase A